MASLWLTSVDDEEENTETDAVDDRGLQFGDVRDFDMIVVQGSEFVLGAEGLSGADGGDDFFSHRACASGVDQAEPMIRDVRC